MSQELETPPTTFIDRRSYDMSGRSPAFERRQFTNSYEGLSPEALDLARAIDGYKLLSPPPLHHLRGNAVGDQVVGLPAAVGWTS